MMIEVYRYLSKGWVSDYWISPQFLFNYPGFYFLEALPGNGMIYLFYGMGVIAFFITIGLFTRLSCLLFALAFSYQFLLDQTHYLNHFYLIMLLSWINVFIPLGRFFSLDNKLFKFSSKPNIRAYEFVLQAQLAIVYFYGGIAKLNSDWLAGEPMRSMLAARSEMPVIGSYVFEPWLVNLFTYGGLLFDLTIVFIILFKPTRLLGIALIILFHLTNHFIFSIGIFPWLMIFLTPLLLPNPTGLFSHNLKVTNNKFHPWIVRLVLVFLLVQLTLPLRHYIYHGNVSWTEQGHRFAWHMKLRSKKCQAIFYVQKSRVEPRDQIDNLAFLSARQNRKMSGRPYMIRDFAYYLREQYSGLNNPDVKVFVWSHCSLNSRPYQVFIDPTIDISRQDWNWSFDREPWIMPLRTPLSPPDRYTKGY